MTAQHPQTGGIRFRRTRYLLTALLALEAGIFFQCLQSSLGWINLNFPGFLVIQNRVVAAAGVPSWEETRDPELLHGQLEGINGATLPADADPYEALRAKPVESPVTYTVRSSSGERHRVDTVVHRFTARDFMALLGVYILNGLCFLGLAAVCVWRWPRCASTPGFLAVGIFASIWAFTACDLYGPYRFFRLHVVAEALLPAAIVHLAWVFPSPLTGRKVSRAVLSASYLLFWSFAVFYEIVALDSVLYPLCNRLASAGLGVSLLLLLFRCVHAYLGKAEKFPRAALRTLLVFALAALGPSLAIAMTMALRGNPPVNYVGYSSFLLPVGLALAAAQTRNGRAAGLVTLSK